MVNGHKMSYGIIVLPIKFGSFKIVSFGFVLLSFSFVIVCGFCWFFKIFKSYKSHSLPVLTVLLSSILHFQV